MLEFELQVASLGLLFFCWYFRQPANAGSLTTGSSAVDISGVFTDPNEIETGV
jgi:hypothetical protein